MDDLTYKFYQENSVDICSKYNNVVPGYLDDIRNYLFPGCRLLDIGCGSGRDVHYLSSMGVNAFGVDISGNMIEFGVNTYPELKDKLFIGNITETVPEELDIKWDVILISAMLQHLNTREVDKIVGFIKNHLNDNGTVIISVPEMYPNIINNRDNNGRLFIIRDKNYYLSKFENIGLKLIKSSSNSDSLKRESTMWTILYLLKSSLKHQ